ncbi:MAG: BON domain-containing protein [Chloroflexi bacterium]|nr:BON domain-containing protein [Chloroflexota bacterium]
MGHFGAFPHPGYPSPFTGFGGIPSWYGLGGLRRWGGTYSPQFTTTGLPTDEEISEMVYDAIDDDPLIPWDAEINVDVEAGEVTLTGTVPNKRIKHAAGDNSWWIPGVVDVHNSLQVTGHRRARGAEQVAQPAPQPAQPARRAGRQAT